MPSAQDWTWLDRTRHRAGVWTFSRLRKLAWRATPARYRVAAQATRPGFAIHQVWHVSVPLTNPHADPVLDAGKLHNLRVLAQHLDGSVWAANQTYSFWHTVGPLTAEAGYVVGAELRAGCVIPTLGGGVCLLTNCLYTLALTLGWAVIERHAHTLAYEASEAFTAPDATVFWPYVDLRLRPHVDTWLTVRVSDTLDIAAYAATELTHQHVRVTAQRTGAQLHRELFVQATPHAEPVCVARDTKLVRPGGLGQRNCLTCGETCDSRPRNLAALPRAPKPPAP